MKLLIFFLVFIHLALSCDVNSCGLGGVCMNSSGLCNCGSNYMPSGNSSTCTPYGLCFPVDFSTSAHLLPHTVYEPVFTSTFGAGMWSIDMRYSQAQYISRNIKIYSKTGNLCKELNADLANPNLVSLPWIQSVSSTCQDIIQGNFEWNSISVCLQSEENLFEGNVVSETLLYGSLYNSTHYSKDQISSFTTSNSFSFNFAANINTNTSDYSFDLRVGTNITIVLNITAPSSQKRNGGSCLLDGIADHFNVSNGLFVILNDINTTASGYQEFTFLVMETSNFSSEAFAAEIQGYIDSTPLSCAPSGNDTNSTTSFTISTVSTNISVVYQQVFFRLTNYYMNTSSLKLQLDYQLRITYPLVASNLFTYSGDNVNPVTVTVGNDVCDSSFCVQTISFEMDLSGYYCSGVTKASNFFFTPTCMTGGIQQLCDSYLTGINGQKILLPVSFSANWCPIQEKTEIQKTSFLLFNDNSSPIFNGDVLTETRSIRGSINLLVLSKVTNSQLTVANITQLVLSDGINAHLIPGDSYTQSVIDQTTNFTLFFNHTIDPSVVPLNFQNPLSYVATISATFAIPNKRSEQKYLAGKQRNVIPTPSPSSFIVTYQSIQFRVFKSSGSSPSNSPSTSSSGKIIGISVGVSVGGVFLLILGTVLVLYFVKKKIPAKKSTD